MLGKGRLLALAATAVCATPATAGAATTIGSTAHSSAENGHFTVIQAKGPGGDASYVVPPGNWVLTSASARLAGGGQADEAAAVVARPAEAAGEYLIRRKLFFAEVAAGAPEAVVSATPATPIPVSGGDVLGLEWGASVFAYYTADAQAEGRYFGGGAPEGSTQSTNLASGVYAVSATLEPDADGDGWGDETQDQCPTDETKQTPPCRTDLSAAVVADKATVKVGESITVTGTVTNNGPETTNVDGTLSWGQTVQPTATSDPAACPLRPDVIICGWGPVAPSGARTAAFTFTARFTGDTTFSLNASTASGDPNAANNAATAKVTVLPADDCSLTKAARRKLRRKSLAAARRKAKAAGCAVKVKKPKRKVRKGYRLRVRKITVSGDTATIRLKAYRRKR